MRQTTLIRDVVAPAAFKCARRVTESAVPDIRAGSVSPLLVQAVMTIPPQDAFHAHLLRCQAWRNRWVLSASRTAANRPPQDSRHVALRVAKRALTSAQKVCAKDYAADGIRFNVVGSGDAF
jgi:NAD(P)-dependent dehydrogenase (short-subunit alcohol dehydrogenase family)